MRAAVYYGREDVRLVDVAEPSPGPGEVKLRVLYNGICGSDLLEYYEGPITTRVEPHPLTGVKNPVILGHELSGEVVQLGAGTEDLAIGDRVAVEPLETCGHCLSCRGGQYNHCSLLAFHGYNRAGGGLSEFTVVRRSMAHRLPDLESSSSRAATKDDSASRIARGGSPGTARMSQPNSHAEARMLMAVPPSMRSTLSVV